MMTPFIAEFIGTSLLLLLGAGVVANVSLKKTYGENQTPLLLITISWGFAVFVGAYVTGQFSGAHLNPAVTIGLAIVGKFAWSLVPTYLFAQLLGAMFGSWLCYLLYIDHYRETEDEDTVRATFCTAPAIRNFKNNFFRKTKAYSFRGKIESKYTPIEFAKIMEEKGAGEIIIQSIKKDGMMSGYDIDFIFDVSNSLKIPVIALGGASNYSNLKKCFDQGYVSGVAAGSLFVYQGIHKGVLINYPENKSSIFSK